MQPSVETIVIRNTVLESAGSLVCNALQQDIHDDR